jgi:hypothetical protein
MPENQTQGDQFPKSNLLRGPLIGWLYLLLVTKLVQSPLEAEGRAGNSPRALSPMPQSALEKDTPAEAAFPASGSSPGRGARAEDQNRRVKPRWRLQTARPDQLKNIVNIKKCL